MSGHFRPIVDIVSKFDKAVDVVITGHTHRAYVCEIDGRLVTSGDKFGTLVTAIDLKLDPVRRDVISAEPTTSSYASAPTVEIASRRLCSLPTTSSRAIAGPAGTITKTLSRMPNDTGDWALGDIIADAQLLATSAETNGGAQVAFTNPGGIRTDIPGKQTER